MPRPHRFACAIVALLMAPVPGWAQDHIVSTSDVQARLAAAADERAANRHTVEAALATPAAAEAAALLHADLDRVRKGTASLTDAELRDVAARAQLLTTDPVAGTHPVIWVLAVLGAIFVIGIVLLAIDCGQGNCD